MSHKSEKVKFVGFDLPRLILYLGITLAIIIMWNFLSLLLIIGTFIYAAYKFARLAIGGFSCAHCYFKFFVAFGIFIFSLGAISDGSVAIPIIALWVDALFKGVGK